FPVAKFSKDTQLSGTFGSPVLAFAQDPPIDDLSAIQPENDQLASLVEFAELRKAILRKLQKDESEKISGGSDPDVILRYFRSNWYEGLKESTTDWAKAKADAEKVIESRNPIKADPASVRAAEAAVLTEKLVQMACKPGYGPYVTRNLIQFGII